MSLIDRVARTVVDTTTRSIALATELGVVAVRGAVSVVPDDLVDQVRRALAEPLQALLDVPGVVQDTPGRALPRQALDTANVMRALVGPEAPDATDAQLVRRRFDELIERSAQVDDDAGLPAFLEVVAQLTPDEARILRLLDDQGPVPVVDLEAVSIVGRGTRSVLARQTMVGDRAGCAHPEEVDTYLANLARLGIVAFRDEEIEGHPDYQLVMGTEAYRAASRRYRDDRLWRARGRRGSLRLTPFGARFLAVCTGQAPASRLDTDRTTTARPRTAAPAGPATGPTTGLEDDGPAVSVRAGRRAPSERLP